MPDWKSCVHVLVSSMLFIIGTHFLKNSVRQLTEYVLMHLGIPKLIAVMCIVTISTVSYLRSSYLHNIKAKEFLHSHREYIGVSIAFSSCIYTIRSFYLSLYSFEVSLANLYEAFAFMILSIGVMYGKSGVPSSTVVLRASYLSLLLAFLGLSIMIMPNMMNSAFVVAFTATFSLVISVALFMMNISRNDIVFYESQSCTENVESSKSVPDVAPGETGDIAEVFTDDESVLDESSPSNRTNYANRAVDISHDTFHTPRRFSPKAKEVNNNGEFEKVADEMVDEIINDLTEQAKSMDNCVNYLLSNKNSSESPVERSESTANNQVLRHRKVICHDCRHKYF